MTFMELNLWLFGGGVALAILWLLITLFLETKKDKFGDLADFQNKLKSEIMGDIVDFLGDSFSYQPTSGLSKKEINESLIFPEKSNGIFSEDYISGTIGETVLEFSEVILTLRKFQLKEDIENNTQESNLKDQVYAKILAMQHRPFFRGLYFIADFHKHFQGQTIIRPMEFEMGVRIKKADGSIGKIDSSAFISYQSDKRLMSSNNRQSFHQVHLENQELESVYDIYSTDQTEARYILTTTLLDRLQSFHERTDRNLFISFFDSRIHFAIPFQKDLFDVESENVNRVLLADPENFVNKVAEMVDDVDVYSYYRDLLFITDIVDEFNLNTRIWSKE